MSEYMRQKSQPATSVDQLDNTDTLFADHLEGVESATDKLVDQGLADYYDARTITGLSEISSHPGWDLPNPESVSVSLLERYQDELALIDEMSGIHMRASLVKKDGNIDEVKNRYGADVPQVVSGAKRNIQYGDMIIRSIYRYNDLKQAGFDEQTLQDDLVQMKFALREKYIGPDNKLVRARRRRFLKKKIAELSAKGVVA